VRQVNQKGLERIAAILKERHIHGAQFDAGNVIAWAQDVEYQLDIGNPPAFEIPRHATFSGLVEEHELTEDCIFNGGDE
jgi:hypothetical protein